jgi:hypothetical protein
LPDPSQSTIVGAVAGAANFEWIDDHTGWCRVPVAVGERGGIIQIAGCCSRGGDEHLEFRFGLGVRLARLPTDTIIWARGSVTGSPFQLQAVAIRPHRSITPHRGSLRLAGTVTRSGPDGKVTLELDDGSALRAMLPLDTVIAAGERIQALVFPAPKGRLPWLRGITLADEDD